MMKKTILEIMTFSKICLRNMREFMTRWKIRSVNN